MFLLSKPDAELIETFLEKCRPLAFSYTQVGSTQNSPPGNFLIDHNRVRVGTGRNCFSSARQAVREWKMFDLGWVELYRQDTPIEVGQNVAVLVRHLGFWSLNAARIVYVIDEPDRFGFAYGTLVEHNESGEERFSVDIDPISNDVHYDLFAFSRPNIVLTRLGYPYARHLQKAFARDSKAAMLEASSLPSP